MTPVARGFPSLLPFPSIRRGEGKKKQKERKGEKLCIIPKPIVAYLVGREHVFPTGCAFVCGSASFKFSFIPALLPTLWPIISCNIGHPRLCEAPAPFAFLIHTEHWWCDCRYGGGKLREGGGAGVRSSGEAFITFDERMGSVRIHA